MLVLAKRTLHSNHQLCHSLAKVVGLVSLLALAGCMNSVSGTLHASQQLGELASASYKKLDLSDELLADAMTIQHIVTNAEPNHFDLAASDSYGNNGNYGKGQSSEHDIFAMRWNNAQTGSQGQINIIYEKTSGASTCRKFSTSRLSYDGIANFEGLTCQTPDGGWQLQRFAPII